MVGGLLLFPVASTSQRLRRSLGQLPRSINCKSTRPANTKLQRLPLHRSYGRSYNQSPAAAAAAGPAAAAAVSSDSAYQEEVAGKHKIQNKIARNPFKHDTIAAFMHIRTSCWYYF